MQNAHDLVGVMVHACGFFDGCVEQYVACDCRGRQDYGGARGACEHDGDEGAEGQSAECDAEGDFPSALLLEEHLDVLDELCFHAAVCGAGGLLRAGGRRYAAGGRSVGA